MLPPPPPPPPFAYEIRNRRAVLLPPSYPSPPPPPPPTYSRKPLLHWVKITRALRGSLWDELHRHGEAQTAPLFDVSDIETTFFSASLFSATMPKPEEVYQEIDLRRALKTEIMLENVKMPLPDMMAAVLAMDESVLNIDQIETLIKFCPTKAEMELLKNYGGDKAALGKCEQYFLELMKVPRVESKLRVFSFKIQFDTQITDLKNSIHAVNSACEEVRSSQKLKEIMKNILDLGNTLNQGTAKGSAVGFRLDSCLLKLSDTHAPNSKMTLLHYLCKVLASKASDLLDFDKDLESLESASKIQFNSLAAEMQVINEGMEKLNQELTASESDGLVFEVFRKTLKDFNSIAATEVATVLNLYTAAGRNAYALVHYFGEDPNRFSFEQVTSTLVNFISLFKKAHKENVKQAHYREPRAPSSPPTPPPIFGSRRALPPLELSPLPEGAQTSSPGGSLRGSLWDELHRHGEAQTAPVFDVSDIEAFFSASLFSTTMQNPEEVNRYLVMLNVFEIDLWRAFNTELMLVNVKMPLPDLMAAVLAMDDSVLDINQIKNLIKFCPTKEEMELLKNYASDKETLGKCEQYFLELMKVPRVESKLRVFSFKIQFGTQITELKNSIYAVNSACEEVRSSQKLKEIMKNILYLANTLNQGTAKGSAVGFRLDSLFKLSYKHGPNSNMTLLHYLCKVLASKAPDLLDFHKDLESLESASKIQLESLAAEMQAITEGLEKLNQELTASESDGPVSQVFRKTLKDFNSIAETEVATVLNLHTAAGRNAEALVYYFGEDPYRFSFEQVTATLVNFIRLFKKAHEENVKQAYCRGPGAPSPPPPPKRGGAQTSSPGGSTSTKRK